MSSSFEEPNPFKNPFADVRTPSAWEAIKERTKQERQHRSQALVAVLLDFAGVALMASSAATIGMEDGTFFAALKYAVLSGMCGGGFCILFAIFAVTGVHRGMMPAYYASSGVMQHMTVARGGPVIFPIALVGALAGIFTFTTLGAAGGAYDAGAGHPTATPARAFLGGALGMLPVGLWWLYVRRRAGKSLLAVMAVLASLLSLTCLAGFIGMASGSLQPTHGYGALCDRGYNRYRRGDLNGAIAAYTKAIDLSPREGNAYMGRGLALLEQGKDAEAQKDFDRCLNLAPDFLKDFVKDDLARQVREAKERRLQKQ
jgi:hypothetical protein